VIILIVAGLFLCKILPDGFASISGDSQLGEAVDIGENIFGFGKDAPHTVDEQLKEENKVLGPTVKQIGLTPKAGRQTPPAASLADDLKVLGSVSVPNFGGPSQVGSVLAQDGTIARPFSEVWNPGYAPVDYEFEGAIPLDNTVPVKDAVGSAGADYGAPGGQGVNLTLYYAPWCPHCKNMMGDFDKFQSEHHGKSLGDNVLSIFKVNSEEEPDKVEAAGVNGFPHVTIDGEEHKGFPRDYEGMKGYMEKLFGPGDPGQTGSDTYDQGHLLGVLDPAHDAAPVGYQGVI